MVDRRPIYYPQPKCKYGYTYEQVEQIATRNDVNLQEIQHATRFDTKTLCPEHGPITYVVDIRRFFEGGLWD